MVLKRIISQIYRRLFNLVATVFPVRQHVVLFEAFNGKIPSDNPLYVYQALRTVHPEWKLVWGVKRDLVEGAKQKYPEMIIVPRFSIKWLKVAPVAEFWILNARMPKP